MLISVVITNYNYGDYVAAAIESVLCQSHRDVEIVVVDDASTDCSRDVIRRYADRVKVLFREHGGQLASTNAGFAACRGDAVIFLDADDVLFSDTVARHAEKLADPMVVKSQGYLQMIDSAGRATGGRVPIHLSPSGDYRARFAEYGPRACFGAFTSGNAWQRSFLERVMPLPEQRVGMMGPDGYLGAVDAAFGRIEALDAPVGQYRVHGKNIGPVRYRFDRNYLSARLRGYEERIAFAARHASNAGFEIDVDRWLSHAGWKLTLSRHLLSLWGDIDRRVGVRELCLSPFRDPDRQFGRASVRAVQLAVVKMLPDRLALRFAQQIFDSSWGKRSGRKSARPAAAPRQAGR